MKELFRSFNKLSNEELATLWQNATFVFDTNTLLSIYRYKSSTSEEVLQLMQKLQDRIWIPYHVALEFHRNRLSVIGDQHKKFDDTRTAINGAIATLKKELTTLQLSQRHRHIDPSPLLEGIEEQAAKYLSSLADQEQDSIQVTSEDSLLNRLNNILDGRVGTKPDNQYIQKVMEEGEVRYASKTPPGYKDLKKADDPDNCYKYDGVDYKRQYGDLIVWKQILQNTKAESRQHLIFVTEDNKEDWWQITKGKTTGFRIELLDEIYQETNLLSFKAYSLGGFLQDAKTYLKGQTLSEDAIDEVSLTVDIPQERLIRLIEDENSLGLQDINNSVHANDGLRIKLIHKIRELPDSSLDFVKEALSIPAWSGLADIQVAIDQLLSIPSWARPDHLQDLIKQLLSGSDLSDKLRARHPHGRRRIRRTPERADANSLHSLSETKEMKARERARELGLERVRELERERVRERSTRLDNSIENKQTSEVKRGRRISPHIQPSDQTTNSRSSRIKYPPNTKERDD